MKELKNYTEKLAELRLFQKINMAIFEEYTKLEEQLSEAQKELKEAVKENKKSVEDDMVEVKYIPTFKKKYDFDTFFEVATDLEREAINKAGGLSNVVDKKVFEECVKQGLISLETKSKCFTEEAGPISVRINEKKLT